MKKLLAVILILVIALNTALLLSNISEEAKAEQKDSGLTTTGLGSRAAHALVLPSLLRF